MLGVACLPCEVTGPLQMDPKFLALLKGGAPDELLRHGNSLVSPCPQGSRRPN